MNSHGGRRIGAGRKRGPDTERWSVRIPAGLKEELVEIPLDELRSELVELIERHKKRDRESPPSEPK